MKGRAFAVVADLERLKAANLRGYRRRRIHCPPGLKLLRFSDFFFAPRTHSLVLEPVIRDLQEEHIAALAYGRFWKARYIHLRGCVAFWSAVSAQMSSTVVKIVLKGIGV